MAYLTVKWGLKKQEWGINRGALLLPDGQQLMDNGKNEFVRSPMQQKERVKAQGLGR